MPTHGENPDQARGRFGAETSRRPDRRKIFAPPPQMCALGLVAETQGFDPRNIGKISVATGFLFCRPKQPVAQAVMKFSQKMGHTAFFLLRVLLCLRKYRLTETDDAANEAKDAEADGVGERLDGVGVGAEVLATEGLDRAARLVS